MAEIDIQYVITGLFLFLFKAAVSADTCSYGCGVYTCYTDCDYGCCGTYSNRYCCSEYSSAAVVVGAVIGGLVLMAVGVGIVAYCVMAMQKKKRMVQPRVVQPGTHNNFQGYNHSNRNNRANRPTVAVPPNNQGPGLFEVASYNNSTQPQGVPPYPIGALPPSYNDIYPPNNANNPGMSNQSGSSNSHQVTTNIQTSQQYGQLQIPNSPPPPY